MKNGSTQYGIGVVMGAALWMGSMGLTLRGAEEAPVRVEPQPPSREAKLTTSFGPIIKKVAPSVVNIYSTKMVREPMRGHPFLDDEMLRRFFGDRFPEGRGTPRQREQQGLGSGVVVSKEGYILTNNHVVEGADEIKVSFANSQREYTAKVIGTDPQTDMAVLKIEAKEMQAATLADSDKLEVGDVVLAIGNPFGVGQTVTMGIVSAISRGGFGIVDYEDFIQTDASINPGNSGGALIDVEGRVVGINTLIISPTGGNQGIGFAVPINLARGVMDLIIKHGKVVRGYLGVYIQSLTPDLAKEFGLEHNEGALVGGVSPGTPAAKAGLKEGDIIVEFKGKKVTDSRHLRLEVSQTAPGTKANVKLLRDGKEKSLSVTLEELPKDAVAGGPGSSESGESGESGDVFDGVEITDLDTRMRRQFNIPNTVQGALVVNVAPGSAAAEAGLRPGDVILGINRKPVTNAEDAIEMSRAFKGDRALLRVWSRNGSRYLVLELDKKSEDEERKPNDR